MKAITYHRYGGPEVLALAEVPNPVPRDNEVLIRIRATTVTTGDWRARSLTLPRGFGFLGRLVFGVFGPRQPILGTELAGVIEDTGKAVTRFKVGDEVFAFPGARYGSRSIASSPPCIGSTTAPSASRTTAARATTSSARSSAGRASIGAPRPSASRRWTT